MNSRTRLKLINHSFWMVCSSYRMIIILLFSVVDKLFCENVISLDQTDLILTEYHVLSLYTFQTY